METLANRIMRHVLTGNFDRATFQRGLQAAKVWIASRDVAQSTIESASVLHNLSQQTGVTNSSYNYIFKSFSLGQFDVTDFPSDYQLRVEVTNNEVIVLPNVYLQQHASALAEIVGPTCTYQRDCGTVANNGFYLEKSDAKAAFEDTNPPGERRGAIVVSSSGKTSIVDDQTKWQIVRSNFSGINALAGTSTYFTNKDNPLSTDLFKTAARDRVSYLISYANRLNQSCLSYIIVTASVPRAVAQTSIAFHLEKLGVTSYIAAELELMGAGAFVKNAINGESDYYSPIQPHAFRRDHYMMIRS